MDLDGWNMALAFAAGYVAVTTLVGMMRRRRDALVQDLLQQVEIERRKRKSRQRSEEHDRVRQQARQREAA